MGNSGFVMPENSRVGLYLHWDGGRDSVDAFLTYAELAGCLPLGASATDEGLAALAAFTATVMNFVEPYGARLQLCDPWDPDAARDADNGVYIVKDFAIIARYRAPEVEQDERELVPMLKAIDLAQPEHRRLGADRITRAARLAAAPRDAERLRLELQLMIDPDLHVFPEDGHWLVVMERYGFVSEGRDIEEAMTDLLRALREYALDWEARLSAAPNHAANRDLVELVRLSTDEQLRDWLRSGR